MPVLSVLVSGAGIAGCTLAFWLARKGHNVLFLEKAPQPRSTGLGIDVRGQAVDIVRLMGIEAEILGHTTSEEGMAWIDERGRQCAFFEVDQDDLENSPTSDIEIMRSDLTRILLKAATKFPNVRVAFGMTVKSLTQDQAKVHVQFSSGEKADYDVLVAADGLGSSTRSLIFDSASDRHYHTRVPQNPVYSLNHWGAHFTIPRRRDDENIWKWYSTTGRRMIHTRPKTGNQHACYLGAMPSATTNTTSASMQALMHQSVAEQKAAFAKIFDGAGWQTERLVRAMNEANDFYLQHIAQVKLPVCPFAGGGSSLDIIGAYVLAGEINKSVMNATPDSHAHDVDIARALVAYDKKLRPFVLEKQKLPPGVPSVLAPKSKWGVQILKIVVIGLKWVWWLGKVLHISQLLRALQAYAGDTKLNVEDYLVL